jgi:hypothetical protein
MSSFIWTICLVSYVHPIVQQWLCSPLLGPGLFFSFVIFFLTQSVGLLGRVISPSQGPYLHTEQHKHRINSHRHLCLEWDSNPRSQRSIERKQFVPQTARPLWSVIGYVPITNWPMNWLFNTMKLLPKILTVAHLLKTFPIFCVTRMFTAFFTKAHC